MRIKHCSMLLLVFLIVFWGQNAFAGCYTYNWVQNCEGDGECVDQASDFTWWEGSGTNWCTCWMNSNGYWPTCESVEDEDYVCETLWYVNDGDCDDKDDLGSYNSRKCISE